MAELNRSLHNVGLPLNHAQFAILQNLFLKDGQSQSDIARCVNKDRAAISRSLNALEEHGFIVRKAVSGSKNAIYLTQQAIQNRDRITEAINMAIGRGRRGMTEEEYETGIGFLKKIYANLHSPAACLSDADEQYAKDNIITCVITGAKMIYYDPITENTFVFRRGSDIIQWLWRRPFN
ncbi:MAG: MarR family transcriptional regulator [Muribaculaceae bacterium]|nr:MarR family transcriptional regulator [Muribaculaceae bacterium]